MAKTIIQHSAELAEKNAELIARVSALEAQAGKLDSDLSAATTQIAAIVAERDAAVSKIVGLEAAAKEYAKAIDDLTAERDAAQLKVKEQAAIMALHPELNQPAGRHPIPHSESSGDAADQPQTWADAMKLCGGDYVAARRRFPKQFDAFMKEPK